MEKIVNEWTKSNKDIEDLEMLIELCDTELSNCSNLSTKVELLFHKFLFELIRENSDKFSIITKLLAKQIVCSMINDTNGILKLSSGITSEELGYCYYYHRKRSFKIRDYELDCWDKLINFYNEDYTFELFDYIIDNL